MGKKKKRKQGKTNSYKALPIELFQHPLADYDAIRHPETGESLMNMWGGAVLFVHTASTEPDNEKALKIFLDGVSSANPLVDAHELLRRCRQGDAGAIRQAITLVQDTLQTRCDKAFEASR